MSLRDRMLTELKKHMKTGITEPVLQSTLLGITPSMSQLQEYADAINQLLVEGRLVILQKGNDTIYKAKSDEEVEKLQGLTPAQTTLYTLIENKGRDGIWKKKLKELSMLPDIEFNKAMKGLESKQLIKSFKSMQSKNKIFYILFELTPSEHHVGDIWVNSDMELDREFIDVLSKTILDVVSAKGYMTMTDILNFINESQISKVQLELRHVEQLVNALEYDGKVEKIKNPRAISKLDELLVKPSRLTLPTNGLTSVPCGACPVFDLCDEEGDITPKNCQYYTQWLDF